MEIGSWRLDIVGLDDGVDDNTHANLTQLIHCAMLCNDSKISNDNTITGEPTETALIDLGFKLGFSYEVHGQLPRVEEIPFDSDRKLMTVIIETRHCSAQR